MFIQFADACMRHSLQWVNTLRPRQNGRLFADDTFKRIFLNENIRISTKNSLKFVPKGLINNIPALGLIMAWRRPGDKPLSEPMMVRLPTHICITRPQWVNVFLQHRDELPSKNTMNVLQGLFCHYQRYWLNQWEATLHCKVVSHGLSPYRDWFQIDYYDKVYLGHLFHPVNSLSDTYMRQ